MLAVGCPNPLGYSVDVLVACGFELQKAPPRLLSQAPSGEEVLQLSAEKESTSFLVKARRLIMTSAINDLGMTADDLPKYKPPARLTDPGDHAVGRNKPSISSGEFNPYQGQRFDAKSAAVGKNLGPDANYVSSTEKQLKQLQSQQAKLEESLHQPLADRELSASLPNSSAPAIVSVTSENSATRGPSDGSLLMRQAKKKADERKRTEEGGFTTKAMRDLQQMKKQKVYSHAQLRIQFPDGSSLEAKFLPKEKIQVVREVIHSCFVPDNLDFDLYVAPPRRKLQLSNTLHDEGLVPAAKVFVSWAVQGGPSKNAPVGSFLKQNLFSGQASQAYPSSEAVIQQRKKPPPGTASNPKEAPKSSKEEDLLRRMMGNRGSVLGRQKKDDGKSGKPKWFKG